jgi:hypothetical protein
MNVSLSEIYICQKKDHAMFPTFFGYLFHNKYRVRRRSTFLESRLIFPDYLFSTELKSFPYNTHYLVKSIQTSLCSKLSLDVTTTALTVIKGGRNCVLLITKQYQQHE